MSHWLEVGTALVLILISILLFRFAKIKIERPERKLKLYLAALVLFVLGILVYFERLS